MPVASVRSYLINQCELVSRYLFKIVRVETGDVSGCSRRDNTLGEAVRYAISCCNALLIVHVSRIDTYDISLTCISISRVIDFLDAALGNTAHGYGVDALGNRAFLQK